MAEVVWSGAVLLELDIILAYIRRFDPRAGERIVDRLVEAADSLTTFPNRGRPARYGTRELPTIRPYILRHEVVGEVVNILEVRHGRRLPPED